MFSFRTYDIEAPFVFGEAGTDYAAKFANLSQPDQVRLIAILIRARRARALGVFIPIETLLAGDPL